MLARSLVSCLAMHQQKRQWACHRMIHVVNGASGVAFRWVSNRFMEITAYSCRDFPVELIRLVGCSSPPKLHVFPTV